MSKFLRILVIEDSENDALLLVDIFTRAGYDIRYERVETEGAMDAALSKQEWDAVISDYAMPEFSGLAALRVLQRRAIDIPFIILSGKMGEDVAVEAMKTGADDFLTKRDRERIVIVVENALRGAENRRELKRTEMALRESERKMSALVGNLPGFVYRCANDHQWTMEYISEGCRSITGYAPEDLIMNRKIAYAEIIHPDFRESLCQAWQEKLRQRKSFEGEYQIITAQGETRWVLERGNGVFDPDGNVISLEGFIADITERKQTEVALQHSKARLDLALKAARMGVWQVDLVKGKRIFDDQTCALLGIDPKTFGGSPEEFFAVVHPDDRDMLKAALANAIEKGGTYDPEYRVVWPDGSVHHMLARAEMTCGPGGHSCFMNGVVWDITESRKIEESLHESQERFSHIVHSSPMGVYLYELAQDGRLVLIEANPAADKIIGIDHSGLIGKTIEEAFPGLAATEIPLMFKKIADNGVPAHITQFDYNSGDVKGTFEIDAFQTGAGKIAVMFNDITERKRLEDNAKKEQAINNAIIDSIPGAFYLIDENGCYARWNAYQRDEIVGKPEDQLSSVSAIDTIHLDDRELIRSKIFSVLKDGVTEIVEGRVLLRGGPEFRWLLMTGRQMKLGDKPFLVGIGIDITERKKIEAALASSQQYLTSIINSVADPIFVKDREHRWVLCNNAFYAFIGHTQEEIEGRSDYDFFPKSEADVFWAKDEEVFRYGGENVNEEFFTDGKGIRRTILTKKTLYKDTTGKQYIVGIIQDITEQKKAEDKILKHAKEMEVFYKASFGREERILELKKKVFELEKQLGKQG